MWSEKASPFSVGRSPPLDVLARPRPWDAGVCRGFGTGEGGSLCLLARGACTGLYGATGGGTFLVLGEGAPGEGVPSTGEVLLSIIFTVTPSRRAWSASGCDCSRSGCLSLARGTGAGAGEPLDPGKERGCFRRASSIGET